MFLSLTLTGVIPTHKHLNVTLPWLPKSAIFLTNCSHFQNIKTLFSHILYKYVDWDFSFYLYPSIRAIKSFRVQNNKIFFKHRQNFTMTNKMASSELWTLLYVPILIPTIEGTIGCAISDNWYQTVWLHNLPDEAMLFLMLKTFLYLKNILLFRILKDFIPVIDVYTWIRNIHKNSIPYWK